MIDRIGSSHAVGQIVSDLLHESFFIFLGLLDYRTGMFFEEMKGLLAVHVLGLDYYDWVTKFMCC